MLAGGPMTKQEIRKDSNIEKMMYLQMHVFKRILQKVAVANASI